MKAAKDAWAEEDDSDMRQSLHQKEVLTSQMIDIISTRLNALQTTANNRKFGLECDLKTNSEYCSKLVPPLQDPYENRSSAINKGKVATAPVSASTQAMMERLFGSDDKTRTRTQALKKTKLDAQKNDLRRNVRAQLEKQLQASVDGHITRTVDSHVYGTLPNTNIAFIDATAVTHGSDAESSSPESPPLNPTTTVGAKATSGSTTSSSNTVHINAKVLLLYTLERMRILQNKKVFKRFLISELSCSLFEEMFWLCFCHFFQKNSMAQQNELIDRISSKHVKMLTNTALHSNLDFICKVYPYAVASAITWGFHYVFPGSRHLYSLEFKNEVFVFVSQLLLGVNFAPICIHATRKQLFPEDVVEETTNASASFDASEPTEPSNEPSSSNPSNSSTPAPFFAPTDFVLPPLPGASIPKCASESCLKKDKSATQLHENECTIDRILKKPLYEEDQRKREPPRNHQLRGVFNSSQLSPLLTEYFGSTVTKSVKKPCFLLRTTPFPNCPVGGEENYHQYYDKHKTIRNFTLENSKHHAKCFQEIYKLQRDHRRELDMLTQTRSIVLNSGKKALQAYCTVLISKKSTKEDQDMGAVLASSASAAAVAAAAAAATTATAATSATISSTAAATTTATAAVAVNSSNSPAGGGGGGGGVRTRAL